MRSRIETESHTVHDTETERKPLLSSSPISSEVSYLAVGEKIRKWKTYKTNKTDTLHVRKQKRRQKHKTSTPFSSDMLNLYFSLWHYRKMSSHMQATKSTQSVTDKNKSLVSRITRNTTHRHLAINPSTRKQFVNEDDTVFSSIGRLSKKKKFQEKANFLGSKHLIFAIGCIASFKLAPGINFIHEGAMMWILPISVNKTLKILAIAKLTKI